MSRENAIKFLRAIRTGIDALQNAYRTDPDLNAATTTVVEKENSSQVRGAVVVLFNGVCRTQIVLVSAELRFTGK